MLASITPLGERGRRRRWGHTTTAFTAASVAGGALVGAAAGAVGVVVHALVHPSAALLLTGAGVCAVSALADALRRPLPGPRRQVDENWLIRYRGWVYGAG